MRCSLTKEASTPQRHFLQLCLTPICFLCSFPMLPWGWPPGRRQSALTASPPGDVPSLPSWTRLLCTSLVGPGCAAPRQGSCALSFSSAAGVAGRMELSSSCLELGRNCHGGSPWRGAEDCASPTAPVPMTSTSSQEKERKGWISL